jgi:signal transduction histidine kinase
VSDLAAAVILTAFCGLSFLFGFRAPVWLGLAAVGLLFAGVVAVQSDNLVPALLVAVPPWGAGRYLRSRHELVKTLATRTRELEDEQDRFTRLAVRRERARIARELHDIVSHHLAVIVVQAGAGRVASARNGDAAERFRSIRRSGDEALDEISRLAELLADPEVEDSNRPDLQVLIDQARATGLAVDSTPLPAVHLPPAVERIAYRVVQEGLTNAMKHAPGSEVRLRVAAGAGALDIELQDRGGEAPSAVAESGSGMGIAGMRERVESLGGKFEAGPDEDGWRVFAHLPLA